MLQMTSFGTILDNLRPKADQMLQMVSFGTILNHFGLMAPNCEFWYNFGQFRAQACPDVPNNPPTLVVCVLELVGIRGEFTSPLPPSALGPSPPDLGPNSSIRKLYVNWGLALASMNEILRRGGLLEIRRPSAF